MEELLKQILSEVKRTNERLDQTADLSEFKTTTVDALNKIEADVEFLTHKETQTEKAIFNIERRFPANR
jgi:hypothetical protein